MDSLYPVEFLDTLRFSGIANHELEFKVGVPILLLRNLNQSIGLCNGFWPSVIHGNRCLATIQKTPFWDFMDGMKQK